MKYDGHNMQEVLERHLEWLDNPGNPSDEWLRADFEGCSIIDGYHLLAGANLAGARFRRADLSHINLTRAKLNDADLAFSDLSFANLSDADLTCADLTCANMFACAIANANFQYALFRNAIVENVIFGHAAYEPDIPMTCPESGGFIGWKKCMATGIDAHQVIVKLYIPPRAKRSSAGSRKCRCSEAYVIDIQEVDSTVPCSVECATSLIHMSTMVMYKKGQLVKCEKPFEDNRWIECASGIHFFMSRREAVIY